MQSIKTEGPAENADTLRRSNMDAKKFFLVLFILCILSFFPLLIFFTDSFLYEAPIHLGFFSIAMYFLWKRDLKTTLKSMGVPGNIKKNVLYIIGGFIAILITLFALGYLLTGLGLNDQKNIMDIVNMLPLYLLAMAVVFAPISEELFFRALLINKIGERTGQIAAILIAAAVFAVLHISYGSVVELVGAFSIAVILGVVYVKSESIMPPIAIHMIFNFLSISFMLWFG